MRRRFELLKPYQDLGLEYTGKIAELLNDNGKIMTLRFVNSGTVVRVDYNEFYEYFSLAKIED